MDLDNDELETELELEDRGDDVDPDLPDDIDDEGEQEEEVAEEEAEGEDLDADDLADLAGEGGKGGFIPKGRFDEVNNRAKEEREARLRLEEENARLRGMLKPADEQVKDDDKPAFDMKEARKQLREALYEGDDDKVDALEEQIEQFRQAEAARVAREELARTLAEQRQAAVQSEVQAAAAEVASKYPELDSNSPDFDEAATVQAVALRDHFIKGGMSPGEAIRKAADRMFGEKEVPPKNPAALTPSQIKQGIERSKRIPPREGGIGERAQKIDYSAMTEDEFDSLPEAEKRKARGDFV